MLSYFRSLIPSRGLGLVFGFAVLFALLTAVAFAAGTTSTVSWVLPTAYNDCTPAPCNGSALSLSEIKNSTVTWTAGVGGGPTGSLTVNGSVTTASVPVPCGSVVFSVSVTTTAAAKYPSATSAAAGFVTYASGVTCAPNPPTGVTAN